MAVYEYLSAVTQNPYVLVKHRKGSGDEDPSDGSSTWKEFWEKHSGEEFGECACERCSEPATDGAHVIKAESSDKSWYIVPMCHKCNVGKVGKSFGVKKGLLVPVESD